MQMKKAVSLTITGKVQNVGFRHHTVKQAEKHHIKGYVKNMPDGSVHVDAEGEEENLDHFILWCHEGPTWARVDHVHVQDTQPQGYEKFDVH